MEDAQKEEIKQGFFSIFKDSNSWNEKTIVGFMAFAVIIIFAFTDLITGIAGIELVIKDSIYNSLVIIVLGSFGIDGIQRFAGKRSNGDQ